jgi:hypothetical protein|tara:strand:+ start:4721 stop:4918 length:198 start_codon:yes stop_codon:yes gene_type:complete
MVVLSSSTDLVISVSFVGPYDYCIWHWCLAEGRGNDLCWDSDVCNLDNREAHVFLGEQGDDMSAL